METNDNNKIENSIPIIDIYEQDIPYITNYLHLIYDKNEKNIESVSDFQEYFLEKKNEMKFVLTIAQSFLVHNLRLKAKQNATRKKLAKTIEQNKELEYRLITKDKTLQVLLNNEKGIDLKGNINIISNNVNYLNQQNSLYLNNPHVDEDSFKQNIKNLERKNKKLSYNLEILSKDFEIESNNEKKIMDRLIKHHHDSHEEFLDYNKIISDQFENLIAEQNVVYDVLEQFYEIEKHEKELFLHNQMLKQELEDSLKMQKKFQFDLEEMKQKTKELEEICSNTRMHDFKLSLSPISENSEFNEEKLPSLAFEIEKDIIKRKHFASTSYDEIASNVSDTTNDFVNKKKDILQAKISTKLDSKVMEKWKKMAASSRGLQLTKDIAKEESPFPINHKISTNLESNESIPLSISYPPISETNINRPKILLPVDRLQLYESDNLESNSNQTNNVLQPTRKKIISRFGDIESEYNQNLISSKLTSFKNPTNLDSTLETNQTQLDLKENEPPSSALSGLFNFFKK